jgi:tetratricopeptide (TPR) repeat protein
LPTGQLQPLSSTTKDSRYLVLDSIARNGEAVRATVLVVGRTGVEIDRKYALLSRRETIDCANKAILDEIGGFHDATGKLVETKILSSRIGRQADSSDFEVTVACDVAAVGKGRIVAGWKAAQREAQVPPEGLAAAAEADPKNAEAWAWLCASGARGRWRPQTPRDCDKAVELAPDSAATRLDRGFLRLSLGHRGDAEADFKAVLDKDPANAAALLGRSLVAAMRGDTAASQADRRRALELDPKIPDWVEASYGFLIDPRYRSL